MIDYFKYGRWPGSSDDGHGLRVGAAATLLDEVVAEHGGAGERVEDLEAAVLLAVGGDLADGGIFGGKGLDLVLELGDVGLDTVTWGEEEWDSVCEAYQVFLEGGCNVLALGTVALVLQGADLGSLAWMLDLGLLFLFDHL